MEVRYCTSAGGRRKKFELLFPYLNDDEIAVAVVFEQRSSGSWKPIKAIIDKEESTADIDDAMVDLEDLWWFMFPKNETNRVLPPIVASWEIDNWIILACLNERYQIKHSRIADNKNREIISDRILCWCLTLPHGKQIRVFLTKILQEVSIFCKMEMNCSWSTTHRSKERGLASRGGLLTGLPVGR